MLCAAAGAAPFMVLSTSGRLKHAMRVAIFVGALFVWTWQSIGRADANALMQTMLIG